MNALYEEFKGRGFVLLLVNMWEDPEIIRRAVKARHRSGAQGPVDVVTLRRRSGRGKKRLRTRGIPPGP